MFEPGPGGASPVCAGAWCRSAAWLGVELAPGGREGQSGGARLWDEDVLDLMVLMSCGEPE